MSTEGKPASVLLQKTDTIKTKIVTLRSRLDPVLFKTPEKNTDVPRSASSTVGEALNDISEMLEHLLEELGEV